MSGWKARSPSDAFPLRWIPRLKRVVNQSSGLLFGVRHEDEVRVLAARAEERPDGLAPVGTFVCRARGEVFLTDDDLANFEKHQGVARLGRRRGAGGLLRARTRRKRAGDPQSRGV